MRCKFVSINKWLLVWVVTLTYAPAIVWAEVKVGVADWPGYVAWYIAEQKGYFKKYGANVKLVWFPNLTDGIAALAAGEVDANSQTWSDTLPQIAKGVPVKGVLVYDYSAGNDALLVNPNIKSVTDLKGKRIALEQFTISHFLLATALQRNNMNLADVKIVNLAAGDATAAFLRGKVDAAVVWNPWINQIEASGKGKTLFSSKDMLGMAVDLLVAQDKSVRANRKDYVGMIKAWYDAEKFIRENPDEAVRIMAKVAGVKPADYKVLLPGMHFYNQSDNLLAFGPASDAKSLLAVSPIIAKFLLDNKLMDNKVDFAKGLDASLVQEAAK